MATQLETRHLLQTGVLWLVSGTNAQGMPIVASPVEIKCRWQLSSNLASANLSRHRKLVGSAQVDRTITVGSILKKATLASLGYPLLTEYSDLLEVVEYSEVPSIRNRYVVRTVMLSSYPNKLPEIYNT